MKSCNAICNVRKNTRITYSSTMFYSYRGRKSVDSQLSPFIRVSTPKLTKNPWSNSKLIKILSSGKKLDGQFKKFVVNEN